MRRRTCAEPASDAASPHISTVTDATVTPGRGSRKLSSSTVRGRPHGAVSVDAISSAAGLICYQADPRATSISAGTCQSFGRVRAPPALANREGAARHARPSGRHARQVATMASASTSISTSRSAVGRSPATAKARQRHPNVATLELPHVCDRIIRPLGRPRCSDYLRQLLRDSRAGERRLPLPVVQEIPAADRSLMADRGQPATNH